MLHAEQAQNERRSPDTQDPAVRVDAAAKRKDNAPLNSVDDGAHPISELRQKRLMNKVICPDLTFYWTLQKNVRTGQVQLSSRQDQQQYNFSEVEGLMLCCFTGKLTISQVCELGKRKFNQTWSPELIWQLISKLLELGILCPENSEPSSTFRLKPGVEWILHQDGYWILRNAEDFTFMQLPFAAKDIVQALAKASPQWVARRYHVSMAELKLLMQQLAATGMFIGTQPPQPAKGKFKPTQLLFFKRSLCNPDRWLTQTLPWIRWIWSRPFVLSLLSFLAVCSVIGSAQRQSIFYTGMQLWQAMGAGVFLPFGMLAMAVVTIHELGHAYTLKQYGGTVPEVGFMFMCLMPAAYTNTTDQYALTRRQQRIWVVAAGVLCQVTIAAIALCLWNLSVPGSWLAFTSYLLMVAALFTVALNLNPLARFDGYYLLTALTGINNLRARSFQFYRNFISRQPCTETVEIHWILACYAPLSFVYLILMFGRLFTWLGAWAFTNMPFLMLSLSILWLIYYLWPSERSRPEPQV